MKFLITTVPFGTENRLPLDLLEKEKIEYTINPFNKKLTESDLLNLNDNFDVIIAGTEPITDRVIDSFRNLKFISRVGIGLDSVDLISCRKKGVQVSYTPDAPSKAVAELTVSLSISLLRKVQLSNLQMHNGLWNRYYGKRLAECVVGIIGVGRIGSHLIRNLSGFGCKKILLNDLMPAHDIREKYNNVSWVSKEDIYSKSDIITLHVPLTKKTHNLITSKEIKTMKKDVVLINTSRGGIINESDLINALSSNLISGAAIDVFEDEPYSGPLCNMENCILTSHMGSMSFDCRTKMEIEATEEAIRFYKNQTLKSPVPKEEYIIQEEF